MMRLPDTRRTDVARVDGERLLAAWAAAEAAVAKASASLQQEDEELFVSGLPLDEDRFHRLVCDYLLAQREALRARQAWLRWQTAHAVGSAGTDRAGAAVPSSRLRFARWLYLHGRIAG
jgi:hypothetical protein